MTLSFHVTYWWGIFTPLLLVLLTLGAVVLDLLLGRARARWVGAFVFTGLIITLVGQIILHSVHLNALGEGGGDVARAFQGQILFDHFSILFNYLFLIAAAVTTILALTHFKDSEDERGEFYILLLIATTGMCLMAAAHDLLIFFVGLEIMSIAVYVMVGIQRSSLKSGEGSMKYLLLGAFSSGILLYGMALVYGASGSIDYLQINHAADQIIKDGDLVKYMLLVIGLCLMLGGFFFKVAAVPFHMWTPDVYEGAPTPVTAYMATAVKAAAFAALARVLLIVFMPFWARPLFYYILYAAAVLTMTLGNLTAIAQRNLKRMLAYSSIAHAGYLLVGVTALYAAGRFQNFGGSWDQVTEHANPAAASVIFYLLIYAFMNLGAFGVILTVAKEKAGAETLEDFAGLAKRRPLLAGLMAVFMLSLAGVPPLAGFAAKFFVFFYAMKTGLYILAVIGVLNSAVSAYYYLRVLVVMYMDPEKKAFDRPAQFSGALFVNLLMGLLVICVGLYPTGVLHILWKFVENANFLPPLY